jgi:hypothetical protein
MPDLIFKERVEGVGDRLFNNPLTRLNNNGVRYRTSRMRLPSWVDYNVMTEGVDDIASASIDLSINRISEARPLEVLRDTRIFNNVSKEFRASNLVEEFQEKAPVDGTEIVGDWMHQGSADKAVIESWAREYGRNSAVDTGSGDPTAPHDLIGVSDFHFDPEPATDVVSRGRARFNTPNGTVEVPNQDGTAVFNEDNIGVAAANAKSGYQWNGTAGQFRELAETPIQESVSFPKLEGYAVPNVFNQAPNEESEQQKVSFNVSALSEQDVKFAFRNPNDYTEIISENSLTVPEGTSQIEFEMAASPAVPPLVTEMNPSNAGDVQSADSYSIQAQ